MLGITPRQMQTAVKKRLPGNSKNMNDIYSTGMGSVGQKSPNRGGTQSGMQSESEDEETGSEDTSSTVSLDERPPAAPD